MKRDIFLEQKNKDIRHLSEKEARVAYIKQYFSIFGERVVTVMLNHAVSAAGLKNLTRKLGIIRKEKDEIAIFAEIAGWIYTYGEPRFLSLYSELPKESSAQPVLSPGESPPVSPPDSNVTAESGSTSSDTAPDSSKTIESKPPGEAKKTWPEVDRRSGKDRRVTKDRRKVMEVVFKNRRYGGERRSGKEKRKNWKPTK